MDRRVLVVDDNQDAADTLSSLIELLGCQVKATYDGPTALQALESFQPSIVLLDIGMPGMDGYDVAREMKLRLSTVFLVAVTGWGQEDDQRRAKEAGFDHHLVKPVAFEALKALLSHSGPRD